MTTSTEGQLTIETRKISDNDLRDVIEEKITIDEQLDEKKYTNKNEEEVSARQLNNRRNKLVKAIKDKSGIEGEGKFNLLVNGAYLVEFNTREADGHEIPGGLRTRLKTSVTTD